THLPTRFHRKRAEIFNKKVRQACRQAAKGALLETTPTGFLEKTNEERVDQESIVSVVDIGSATKRFDLKFPGGPFTIDYSRNGRFLAYCGKSGSIGAFDWLMKKPLFEVNVSHACKDIKFLHQETLIAVAEPDATSIYDNQGLEIHCLKQLHRVIRLEFLPYHFLLVASAQNGYLYYLDCTTGTVVANIPTYMGRLGVLCQNPTNGVIITGHNTGVVSMWIPTEQSPVVKLFGHHNGLTSAACDRTGKYLATCALDRKLKVWDLRSAYDPLSEIQLPISANTIAYSQRGLLAIGAGNTVQVLQDPQLGLVNPSWDDAETLCQRTTVASGVNRPVLQGAYLSHYAVRPVSRVQFCPYEDVLGIGTSGGISSILCPGSAEANYDALEENPFANKRYRQEREVKRLLDKLGEAFKTPMPEVKRNKKKGRSKPALVEAKKQNIRFERKMFGIMNVLGVKKPDTKEKMNRTPQKSVEFSRSSDALVVRRKLAKKRLRSALDVLIPSKE
ncbi:Small nucleolar ribonucleoprotein complex subunit, partial [Fasciolopsis buskii]